MINTTGTPYFKKEPLKEVVFWYSLEEGIRDNILKSVKDNIVSYNFDGTNEGEIIGDIIKDFFANYGEVQIYSGQKAKIAFYFKSEEHLQESKLAIEKALTAISQSPTLILVNTQKSSKKEIEDFKKLNSPESQKRIVLLIDKGKEGWNCPSLFATALIREASSSNNFILQASTRCLRQVSENKERAKIYLSSKNIEILDKELRENFNISIGDYGKAAFELHQSAEYAYKTILLVFTLYNPNEHFLAILGKECEEYFPELRKLFIREIEEQKEHFKLLEYAYIGGRYDPKYRISKSDLELLAKDVKKLLEVTKRVCERKIK